MMNIQPGNSTGRKKIKSNKQEHPGLDTLLGFFARVAQTALVIAIFGAFGHTYIKLDQQNDAAISEIRKIDEEMAKLDRDIEGLKGRYADCSSRPFIMRQVARFRLPLVPARHDQQYFMHVYSNEQIARISYPVPRFRNVSTARRERR